MSTPDTFPKSVVLHFPPSIYQKVGASELLPQLLEKLDPDEVRCVQFLRGGRARVTFRKSSARDYWLSEMLYMFCHDIPVTRDNEKLSVLYLRDLPYEVRADDVKDFFSAYGTVLAIERLTSADFPLLFDGNRVIKMILDKDLPYFLSIFGFECRLWYRDQPIQCFVCRELGHRAQSCPLSGRCRRCRQPGHVARECPQGWDSVSRVSVDPVSPVDPSNVPASVSVASPVDPEVLPSVDEPPVDVLVDVSNVDVPVINISSISEPVASEMASFEDDASSRVSVSSESNSDVLGSNGAELFRKNLMTPREDIDQDILDRATENLADAVSRISCDSFLKMSSSGLEKFVMNAFKTKSFAKISSLSNVMVLSLTKLQKVLRST